MLMHEARSSIINIRTFSCAVMAPEQYPGVVPLLGWFTWKPLYTTRPHCCADTAPTGVLKLNSCANWCWAQFASEWSASVQVIAELPWNWRQASGEVSQT